MKKISILGILIMGFTFTVTQGLMVRELLVSFFGNEISIGLILGVWLILEAFGSWWLGRVSDLWKWTIPSFAVLQILLAVFLPLSLLGVSFSRLIAGATPGEGVGIDSIFLTSFLVLAIIAMIDGALFASGSKLYASVLEVGAQAIGRVYALEAFGAVIGGLVFTFLFLPKFSSLQIALILSFMNLLTALFFLAIYGANVRRSRFISAGTIAVLVLLIAIFSFPLGSSIVKDAQDWLNRQQYSGYDLIFSENSVYGNVAVIQQEDQYTYYSDGIPIFSAPVPGIVLNEEIVHLPMLFIDQPRRVLVLGGGVGGVLHELTKYPFEEIDYAELDPLLINAVQSFPTELTIRELGDPRVSVTHVDGVRMVRQRLWEQSSTVEERYDLIIVNLPYSYTLNLNRFYTVNFFKTVQLILEEDGVLVLRSPGSHTYMGDELRRLTSSLFATLKDVFPSVRPIADEMTIWMASPSGDQFSQPIGSLEARWEGRLIEAELITPPYIRYKLDEGQLNWFIENISSVNEGATRINMDSHPVGLLFGLSYWQAHLTPWMGSLISLAAGIKLWQIGVFILCISFAIAGILKLKSRREHAGLAIIVLTTGFAGMAADILMIFTFQAIYGFVYQWVALIISAFMVGLGIGAWAMTRRLTKPGNEKSLILRIEITLLLFWILLALLMYGLFIEVKEPLIYQIVPGIILLLNVVAGLLVGAEFPISSKILLEGQEISGGRAGILYGVDLLGAFLGAILVSLLLIPVIGIIETCIVVVLIKLASLVVVLGVVAR
ncbi:MAG: hypothetical protein GTO18_16805 [Anaerolineales bacterium]|nr:hypothetical protein [Anaerolineales bacterium]